jgi:phospholipase/carboxylesterase
MIKSAVHKFALIALTIVIATSGAGPLPLSRIRESSPLKGWQVGRGRHVIVLLHGYGSSARHWLPFARTIALPQMNRFVFPDGPDEVDGSPRGRRAWWALDLSAYRKSESEPADLSRADPAQLPAVASQISMLLADLRRTPGTNVILGGFSQGAAVAAEVAFRNNQELAALVLLSPAVVHIQQWTDAIHLRKALRVFIAHGRYDDVLTFDAAYKLSEVMRTAGLQVTWIPFNGGHEIPSDVVSRLNDFLRSVPSVDH